LLLLGTVVVTVAIIRIVIIKGRMQVKSQITMEHVIRMTGVIILYWACLGYDLGYRYYIEGIEVNMSFIVKPFNMSL